MTNEQAFKTQGMAAAHAPKRAGGVAIAVVVLLGVLLGGGGVAAWAKSATDPIEQKEKTATLFIDSGNVRVKDSATSAPRSASQGEILHPGMVVMTDAGAQAELRFFDASVARLAPETEVTIEILAHDPMKPTENKVGLSVSIGRVWSRVLNLLSLNAQYTVKSSTTVATVRGTAFDFAVKKDDKGKMWTHVNGAESLIDCTTDGWKGVVKANEWLHVPEEKADLKNLVPAAEIAKGDAKTGVAKGVYFGTLALPEIVNIDWSKANLGFDQEFLDWSAMMEEEEAKQEAGAYSMPFVGAFLNDLAEIRIANATGEERDALMASHAQRMIAVANVYASEGDEQSAMEAIEDLKDFRNDTAGFTDDEGVFVQQLIMEELARGEMAKKYGDKLVQEMPLLMDADWNAEDAMLFQSVLMENRYRDLEEEQGEEFDPLSIPQMDIEGYEEIINENPILQQRYEYLENWDGLQEETTVPIMEPTLDVYEPSLELGW